MSNTPRRISELVPDARPANRGTARGAQMLRGSLARFGAGRSILIDRAGRVIAGNKTVEQALRAGITGLLVVPSDGKQLVAVQRTDLDLDQPEVRAFAVADNRVQEVDLEWAADVLAELEKEVDLAAFWTDEELDELLGELREQEEAAAAGEEPAPRVELAAELEAKWQTARGQLWLVPSKRTPGLAHRILCGDATSREDVAALFAGQAAALVNTDPPYGVSYVSGKTGSIANDDLRGDRLVALLRGALGLACEFSRDTAAFYIWHASSTRPEFDFALKAAGLEEKQYLTWVKDHFVLGHADYQWQTELCYYAQKAGHTAAFHGDRRQSTAWRIAAVRGGDQVQVANGLRILDGNGAELVVAARAPRGKRLRVFRLQAGESIVVSAGSRASDAWQVSHDRSEQAHPNQKPSELAARALLNSSLPRETVYDCFGGSGFTLLGAELVGRAACIMELDPKFVAVQLDRMRALGLEPRRAQ